MNGCLILLSLCTVVSVKPAVYRPVSSLSRLLNLDARLVFSIIYVESGFDQKALSPAGAVGLMQVMPVNLTALGVKKDAVSENIAAGIILFKRYLRLFSQNLLLAVAAYNAGPGAVRRYGGVPPYPETRRYVRRFYSALRNNRYVCEEKGNGSER